MFDSDSSYKNFLIGLAIGGSLSALIFNTKKGKLVQKDILHKYHSASNKAQHLLKEGIDKLTLRPNPKQLVKRASKKAHRLLKGGSEKLASLSTAKRKTRSSTKRKTITKKKKR